MDKVTHTGSFDFGGSLITCHVLASGIRVVPIASVMRLIYSETDFALSEALNARQIGPETKSEIARSETAYVRLDGGREEGLAIEGMALLVEALAGGVERDDLTIFEARLAERCLHVHLKFVLAGLDAERRGRRGDADDGEPRNHGARLH